MCLLSAVSAQWLETSIPVGDNPFGLLYVPSVNKVYCANDDENSISVIDCATNTVRATIATAAQPEPVAWSDAYNRVYISCSEGNRIVVIDAVGDTVVARLRSASWPCRASYCKALDKLYVMCAEGDRIEVVDAAGDSLLPHIHVPLNVPALDWCPSSNLVFFSNDRGDSLTVIDCGTDEVRAMHAGYSAFHMAQWNRIDGLVYTGVSNVMHIFSSDGRTLVDSVVHPARTPQYCFAPYPNKCFVGDFNTGVVYIVDCHIRSVVGSLSIGQVNALALDSIAGRVYVVLPDSGVAVLDARSDSILTVVPVPGAAYLAPSIAWSPRERRMYVAGYSTDMVYVIRDTAVGLTEAAEQQASASRRLPTVLPRLPAGCLAFDATGRRVSNPQPGVYFVREAQAKAQTARKVVVQH